METIDKKSELIKNIETVESYLAEGDEYENEEAVNLIKRGTCFVAYTVEKEIRFAPSRFLGYKNNEIEKHRSSFDIHGGKTNKAISKILGANPLPNENLENLYLFYCRNLSIEPGKSGAFGAKRKFWNLDIDKDFTDNLDLTGEFPEGKIVERKHKARERDSTVVLIAKENFKRKHGRLFCQACEFDFGKTYGELGQGFIEGHHIIPVSEMKPDHKTKPEEIALLCSNCHRMVHKRRPWLKMNELTNLVKKGVAKGK